MWLKGIVQNADDVLQFIIRTFMYIIKDIIS